MRFQCHGCERTVQVRGQPPPGKRVQVTCPACGALNRALTPSEPSVREHNNDAVKRFLDFIREQTKGNP